MKSAKGFTIVELLIVIVIIAVLAAISVSAFNGAQQSSRNSVRNTNIQQIMKLMEMYKTVNGDYPGAAYGEHYCIGDGYPNNYCDASWNQVPTSNSIVNDKLRTIGTLPSNHPMSASRIGTYMDPWDSGWGFTIVTFNEGESASDCPTQIPNLWWNDPNSNAIMCAKLFNYAYRYGR